MDIVRNVRDFGAVGNGIADDTAAIQRAIDAGGVVYFPAGVYLSGALYLQSNGGLRLDDNAVLMAHPDITKWPIRPICVERSPFQQKGKVDGHLICCVEAENVTISGGIIDGNGSAFLTDGYFKKAGNKDFRNKVDGYPGQLIWFHGCNNVKVEDTTIRESQFWSLMFHACNDVLMRGIKLYTREDIMNADGIDIDCCNRVVLEDSFVHAGDDAVAVRAAFGGLKEPQPCENVTIRNCILRSDYAHAIRIGVGSGIVKNCTFSNILINSSRGGIHLNPKFNDPSPGVAISDLVFDNISGSAMSMISVTLDYHFAKTVTYTGVLENIRMANFNAVSRLPLVFNGNTTGQLRNITILDSKFVIKGFDTTPKAERDYFFVKENSDGKADLVQATHTENFVMNNVSVITEE